MTACTSPHCVDNKLHLLDLLGSSQQLPDVMFIVYHGQTDTCFSCHVSGVTVTAPTLSTRTSGGSDAVRSRCHTRVSSAWPNGGHMVYILPLDSVPSHYQGKLQDKYYYIDKHGSYLKYIMNEVIVPS